MKNVRSITALVAVVSMLLSAGCADVHHPMTDRIHREGHDWIVFRVNGNFGQTYVHDPDCPCGK